MTADQTRWQRLNAYVDGELDPQTRAEIAAEIARDRRLAAAAATLTRLKAAAGGAFADAPAVRVRAAPAHVLRRAAAGLALAASLGAAVGLIWPAAGPSVPPGLEQALGRHAAWVASDAALPADPQAAPLLVGLARLERPVELPDLSDAGLQIARIATTAEADGPPGLHVAYLGSRGCRVSLIVTKGGEADPLRLQRGETGIVRWTADGLTYTLLSSGMPPERFALIAASAEEAVRRHERVPEPVREALRRERDTSQPCSG